MGKFAVAHASKCGGGGGGIGSHIDRKKIPQNVDKEKLHLNFELCEKSTQFLRKDIQKVINENYTATDKNGAPKKIRKDATQYVGVIFSGSPEQMAKIEQAGLLKEWAKDTYQFAIKHFECEKTAVRGTVHMDEKTPHMHFGFVPITADGRLSAKEIVDRKRLQSLQDEYANIMAKYGLERGLKGSKTRHITTQEYYQVSNNIEDDITYIQNLPQQQQTNVIRSVLQEFESKTREKVKELNIEKKAKDNKNQYYEHTQLDERKQQRVNPIKQRRFGL